MNPKYNRLFLFFLVTESVLPICLPLNENLQNEGENTNDFQITGWGATETSSRSTILMETQIPHVNHRNCIEYYPNLSTHQLCAGGETGKDSCHGDSGGPLINVGTINQTQRFVQYGIVSFGKMICADEDPSVYTKVSRYIRWIAFKIGTHYV